VKSGVRVDAGARGWYGSRKGSEYMVDGGTGGGVADGS